MSKNLGDVVKFTNLIVLDRVTESQKRSSNFTSDINFVYSGLNDLILRSAVGEKLSDEEMSLLRTKVNNLIADMESILS